MPANARPFAQFWLLCMGLLPSLLLAAQTPAAPVLETVAWARDQAGVQPYTPRGADDPLLIAHRGASGHVPEHTLAAYALAVLQGADYIEPDLVMSRDGHLLARHDNELGLTTTVAQRPEFAARKRTRSVDGVSLEGWFSEDFTLAELKTLRAIERIPQLRPGNTRFDGQFEIPTLQEIIDLVQYLQVSERRQIGLYPETKHPTHFRQLGLPMEPALVRLLADNGYDSAAAPIFIQSFEVDNLKALSRLTSIRLVQLLWTDGQPYDQQVRGTELSYARMTTPAGLQAIATYAAGIGPEKSMVIARRPDGSLGTPTALVADAHAAGLQVHPYTFRAENHFLPDELRSSPRAADPGDLAEELRRFLATGIDGLFTDHPDVAARLRRAP